MVCIRTTSVTMQTWENSCGRLDSCNLDDGHFQKHLLRFLRVLTQLFTLPSLLKLTLNHERGENLGKAFFGGVKNNRTTLFVILAVHKHWVQGEHSTTQHHGNCKLVPMPGAITEQQINPAFRVV